MKRISFILLMTVLSLPVMAEKPLSADLSAEIGFLGIIKHEIQAGPSSNKGDVFNYLTQGNQDTLFPYYRFQIDFEIYGRHHAVLLYQPLTLQTEAAITENFQYNGDTYTTADGFLNLTYAFDFWRLTYLYDIIEPPGYFLSAGIGLQIRNASIRFVTTENGKGSVEDNIGPVPILAVRTGYRWENGYYILLDANGFYATNAFLNGAEYPFMGYIYDMSLQGGYRFNETASIYLNFRFLGGGADGTNNEDQFTYNDLHTFSVTTGFILHL
ncbi:MAG: hypothetical protein P8107_05865 [Spirochaetia bacterium]